MGSAEEAMLKISSSRDEVIEKVKAFLGAMAEGSGADEGAAPGVETPPPERARLGDRAIPADRLVRLSALVSVALNEKASDEEAPEQGDRTIGALITAPVAAPVPRFLQAGLVSTRPVEPRGARTQKGGKKRKAAKEPKEKKKAEKRASKAKSEQGAPEEARAAGEPDSGGDEDEGMAPYYQRARARWGLPAVTIKSSLADDAVHSGPGAAPAPLPKDWAGGLPPELLEKVARAVPAGDRLFFRLVCQSWAKAGARVAAVPPGERPLGPGKATRTHGPDAAASVARAEMALGALEGPARERFKSRLCAYCAKGGHLEVLKWARANGCPWNEATCTLAASNGHLEVLQWARAHGCPWDKLTPPRSIEAHSFSPPPRRPGTDARGEPESVSDP